MNFFQTFLGGQQNQPNPRQQMRIQYYQQLKVYPAQFAQREDIEKGDKILLPASALQTLYPLLTSSKNKDPMIFCIKSVLKQTFCGVLQFVAEEGNCYIPNWMFKMLKFAQPGSSGTIALVPEIKKQRKNDRHMIKLRPHQTKFIELNNPKAVLEYQLRNFTCLHEDDTITIQVFGEKYEIDILQITPKNEYNCICIIEADVDVDFAPPLDYVQPQKIYREQTQQKSNKGGVFGGPGVRIDQKSDKPGGRKASQVIQPNEQQQYDPRRHRIHRGVRKTSIEWTGVGVKIGVAQGGRVK